MLPRWHGASSRKGFFQNLESFYAGDFYEPPIRKALGFAIPAHLVNKKLLYTVLDPIVMRFRHTQQPVVLKFDQFPISNGLAQQLIHRSAHLGSAYKRLIS